MSSILRSTKNDMKILVAPNCFKESLTSIEVAHHIGKGLRKASRKFLVSEVPLADGGTGTAHIITAAFDGELIEKEVHDPLGRPVKSVYGILRRQRVAIIELAEAAGLRLVSPKKRKPLISSTWGVGELMKDAVDRRYNKIILGIGDSATVDCGVGALAVLGARFLDKHNKEIETNCRGLLSLDHVDASQLYQYMKKVKITIASDVKNVLTGKDGALVYTKHKGATKKTLPLINKAFKNFKKVILEQFGTDLDTIPGSGAAGGIGGAFAAILGAEIISGFGLVQEVVRLEDEIKTSDIVITGEGRIDKESFYGKTLKRVIDMAYIYKKPVFLIAGRIGMGSSLLKKYRIIAQYSLVKIAKSSRKAMKNPGKLLESIAYKIGKELAGKR